MFELKVENIHIRNTTDIDQRNTFYSCAVSIKLRNNRFTDFIVFTYHIIRHLTDCFEILLLPVQTLKAVIDIA